MQQVIPNCAEAFIPLLNIIKTKFLPTIIDGSISDLEGILFSLTARKRGMGVHDPVELAYSASKEATTKIVCAIKGDTEFSLQEHIERIAESHSKLSNKRMEQDQGKLETVLESLRGMQL